MNVARSLARLVAGFAVVFAASAAAWAQDYNVSAVTGQWVDAPTTGTTDVLPNISNKDDGIYTITSLPFSFPYFGRSVTSIGVCTNGYMYMNSPNGGQHATAYSPTSYAFPQTTTGTSGRDGLVACAWQDLDGRGATSKILTWTDGTAPNRRFIISYINWQHYSNVGSLQFQAQFYESGRIQMAYTGVWTSNVSTGAAWSYATGVGIDALLPDNRWVTPSGSSTYNFTGTPANDWRFDPKITNFTGRVLYDRLVVDANGIGNTVEANLPLAGLQIELRNATGSVGSGITNSLGDFAIQGVALVGTDVGTIVATGQTPSCAVRTVTGGAAAGFTLATNVPFNADRALGTVTISNSNDQGGTGRAPLYIASTIQSVYEWARLRTANTIPQLEVLYDPNSSAPTIYNKPGTGAAQMRVSGAPSNQDAWDASIVTRTYARHVLGYIAAHPTSGMNTAFDSVTDQENAFAEGFGYYLYAAISGASKFVDGLTATSATTIDMENPALATTPGPDVAGWMAAGLYDLADPANEPWDTIDGGAGASDRPFRTVDSLTAPVTSTTFYKAWGDLGYDGPGLSRNFIRHGLIGDDADEPNDNVTEPKVVSQFGFVRNQRILNFYNEDWFQFAMPESTTALNAQVSIDRTKFNTQIALELRNLADVVIATGPETATPGVYKAVTGPLAAGTYRVRVVHTGGVRLGDYSVQVFSKLEFSSAAFQPWTVGRPYSVPVNIKGGIPPYTLAIDSPFVIPPGLVLDGQNARVRGNPSQEGLYNFILSAKDSANPSASASGPVSFTVNPELKSHVGDFIAFPLNRSVDRPAAFAGGTAPYTATVTDGVLPAGITAIGGPDLRFTGMATAAGSSPFLYTGSDIAGSGESAQTTGVVCVPVGTAGLAFGSSACGFYVDAVQGSTVSVSVKTLAKHPKRPLRIAMLDQDGTTELPARTKGGKGSASVSGFTAPATGRFFCVVSSDSGDTTQLVATAKVVADKSGGGDNGPNNFVAGKTFAAEVGALDGAALTFTATPDRSGLALKAIYLIDPSGTIVTLDEGDVVEKGGSVTIRHTLNATGTWQVLLGAQPGPQGHFKYTFTMKQPKGVVYSAD